MSSTAVDHALDEWTRAVDELSFEDGCAFLGDLHGAATIILSQQLDVIAGIVVRNEQKGELHDYLCMQLGLTRHAAKQQVMVAIALTALPCLRAAFRSGRIDWERLVLAVQLASCPEDDVLLAETARDKTLNQLKIALSHKKHGDKTKAQKAHCERSLRFRHNDEEQKSKIEGSLPLDLGLAMEKLVQERADSFGADAETGEYPKPDQAMADALCELLFGDAGPRANFLVNLEPSAMTGDGCADVEGHAVSKETLQRLSCDATSRTVLIDEHGVPLNLGRQSRLFSPAQSRLIAQRDRGCRFPGCGNTRWIHDHHMLEWDADVGPTDYDNGLQLCGTHHRYVHEGGWKIRGNPQGALTFIRADGKEFTGLAPEIRPKLIATLFDMATASVDRAVMERDELEARREQECEETDVARKQRDEEHRQWVHSHRKYKYPDHVKFNGWGDPAA